MVEAAADDESRMPHRRSNFVGSLKNSVRKRNSDPRCRHFLHVIMMA